MLCLFSGTCTCTTAPTYGFHPLFKILRVGNAPLVKRESTFSWLEVGDVFVTWSSSEWLILGFFCTVRADGHLSARGAGWENRLMDGGGLHTRLVGLAPVSSSHCCNATPCHSRWPPSHEEVRFTQSPKKESKNRGPPRHTPADTPLFTSVVGRVNGDVFRTRWCLTTCCLSELCRNGLFFLLPKVVIYIKD